MAPARPRAPIGSPLWQLTLFDSWRLRHEGRELLLHRREQRLITLLALQGPRPRAYLAGVLWPDSTERHAAGNLRAAVWHADRAAPGLVGHDRTSLRIDAPLRLDVDEFTRDAFRVLSWRDGPDPPDRAGCLRSLPALLHGDLLPGWYDDWVSYERARLAQLRLRALEVLAGLLVDLGEVTEALLAAAAAVAIEPLHEPAVRVLVRAELEHGDHSGALRDYESYRSRLAAELGVAPSERLRGLVEPLRVRRVGRAGRPDVA